MRALCLLVVLGSFACSSEAVVTDGGTSDDAGADSTTPVPSSSNTPLPVPTLAEGTCQFTVDGKTHQGNAITSVATGTAASWQLQCQAADGTRSLTVNLAGNGFNAPGTFTAGVAPAPSGIASYSEQDTKSPGTITMYRQDKGFTVTLTSAGPSLVGAASFVGALAPNPNKPVQVAFHFPLK